MVYRVTFLFDVAIFMVGLSASEMSANWAQWWWWRFNGWGRVAASFGGGGAYLAMRLIWPEMTWWNRMFAAIAISTGLWIVATLLTAPERRELLQRFYHRARPLGFWGPVSGERDSRWGLVVRGLMLAVTGAGSVMAYIAGISQLYVGRYAAGSAWLVSLAVLAYLFWRGFNSYIVELLSPGERAAMEEAERRPVDTVHAFGLAGLTAVIAFIVAIVLGVNALLFTSGSVAWANLAAAMAAIAAGLWLRRKHKLGVITE